jgi:hypothetical protein
VHGRRRHDQQIDVAIGCTRSHEIRCGASAAAVDLRPQKAPYMTMMKLACVAMKNDHLFLNFAGRFSMKAAMPSF